MSAAPLSPVPAPPASTSTVSPYPTAWRRSAKESDDVLGLGWLHGSFCAAVFRRNKMVEEWTSPEPVLTIEALAPVLDAALTALDFTGTEVFLLLENDQFVHQPESAPAFSVSAAHAYLQGRVLRHEKEHERMLWVEQQALSVKQEHSYILHLLPRSFYTDLNNLLLARRLDLTRILPLVVPIKRELDRFPIAKDRPVLVAVEAGAATVILVAKVSGQMILARTIQASWSADPARIGVEINRSRLYAKQQFGTTVERIWLLGQNNASTAEVNAKCGADKQIMVLPTKPVEWLQTVAKISPQHPINLVAGYLKRKRRQSLLRRLLIAACWLGLGYFCFDSWSYTQTWVGEKQRLATVRADEPKITAERDRLIERNRKVEHARALIRQVEEEQLPPVPGKLLSYLASILPREIRLTDLSVKCDDPAEGWLFRLDGAIEADEETAREMLNGVQRQLTQSPLRARFNATARAMVALPLSSGPAAPEVQRFTLEGVMLEK